MRNFSFPEGLCSAECEKTIEITTQQFLRELWSIKGREAARVCAETRLA